MSQEPEEPIEKIELFWDINLGTFSNMFFLSILMTYHKRKDQS